MAIIKVSEIFYSIQGEGVHQGQPMIFVRLQGCNLAQQHGGCTWCDTQYAQSYNSGEDYPIESIVKKALSYPSKKVCLTGGEPLLQPSVASLITALKTQGFWLEVETNGSLPIEGYLDLIDCWSVDVKCPSSAMFLHNYLQNLAILRQCDQVKFVVSDNEDIGFSDRIIKCHPTLATILYSPVHGNEAWTQRIADHVKDNPGTRLSLQIHKFIWSEEKER